MNLRYDAIFAKIVNQVDLQARLLNTFSYLEYIGFRKIVKSQVEENLDSETLSHAVEEGRHALLLKKQAIRIGGRRFETYDAKHLLCGVDAHAYFQDLDQACSVKFEALPDGQRRSRLAYLYVTWLVELRAVMIYESFQRALKAAGKSLPLAGLLVEEEEHLRCVRSELAMVDAQFESNSVGLRDFEDQLFQTFFSTLELEVIKTKSEALDEPTI